MNDRETLMDRAYFNRGIAHFLLFRTKYAHLNIPKGYVHSDGFELYEFVCELRNLWEEGELTEDQLKALSEVGFSFEREDQNWETLFQITQEYVKINGTLPEINQKTSDGVMIGAWLFRQSQVFYQLSKRKRERLIQIGILDRLEELYGEG